jgi:hypothetical protein
MAIDVDDLDFKIMSADNAVNQMLQSQIHAQKSMVDTSFLAHHIQKV